MKRLAHLSATTTDQATTLLGNYSPGQASFIAGGVDVISVLKDDILPTYPKALIDLKTIPNLDYIKTGSSGLQVGALTTLTEIVDSSTVANTWPLLSQAASQVATPQVRNVGTIAGNLCQMVHCWYYRASRPLGTVFVCLRKGGTTCYAASGDNRYHSIFGAPKGCNSVYPSDTATALMALNASIVTNKRTIGIESFFDALTGTVLGSGELITEVDVPTPPAGSTQTFMKFRQRNSLDFAQASVATMVTMSGSTCTAARIALGGVAPTPLRSSAAETAIVGKTLDANAAAAAGSAAVASATPLKYNAFRVQILKTLVTRALTPSS